MALLQPVKSDPNILMAWAGGRAVLFSGLFALCLYNLKGFCLPANLNVLWSSLSRIMYSLGNV